MKTSKKKILSPAEVYELARPTLEAEHEKIVRNILKTGRQNSGRKPLPDAERREFRAIVRFNDEEKTTVQHALGDEIEFAAGLRELALEAARARLNAR